MKRIMFALAVMGLALMASAAMAQDTGLIGKGLKAGLAMYTFGGDDKDYEDVSPDSRMGLAAGGFLTFGLGPNFALQPEVMYVMKGAKYEQGGDKVTVKFDYLDIPVLFKYMFPTEGNTRPNLFAGPVLSIKMSAKEKDEISGEPEETVDVSDDVKSTDFALAFGGGIDFVTGTNTITFDVRYTLGMSDWPDTEEDVSVKNNGWLVTVGLGF